VIYFCQDVDGGSIKIGCSNDVPARVRQLESHYRRPLALLATIEGSRATEAEVHARFGHLRVGRTEQFKPAAELLEFIGRPLLVGANPDAVEAMPATAKPVRLDLSPADHERLERCAKERGLSKSSYARMAVLERIKADEGRPVIRGARPPPPARPDISPPPTRVPHTPMYFMLSILKNLHFFG
jgi:hypothetical protein